MTTTSYGTWYNHTNSGTVESTIADYADGADSDWRETMEAAGAFQRIAADFRHAVNDALPDGIWLSGNEFYAPYDEAERDFSGYQLNEDGELDINAIVEDIDLAAIVDSYDVPAAVETAVKATEAAERAAAAEILAAAERAVAIARLVDACGGNQSDAARRLGLDQSTVNKIVRKATAVTESVERARQEMVDELFGAEDDDATSR